MRTETKAPETYVALASFAVGFAAFIFIHMWSGALPRLFGNPALNAGWAPSSAIAGVLLGCIYFCRRGCRPALTARSFSFAVLAFGLAGIPAWQLLRINGRTPNALLGAGVTSVGALTTILGVITFCVLCVPGFVFGGLLAFGSGRPGSMRSGHSVANLLAPLFAGFAAGALVLVFGMLPRVGYTACMVIAAAVAAVSGLAGLAGWNGVTLEDRDAGETSPSGCGERGTSSVATFHTLFVFGVVTWMVLWFRLCLVSTGPSLQALAALCAALFAGLAAGSALPASLTGRPMRFATGLGIVAGATGILQLFLSRWAGSLPLVFLDSTGDLPLVWEDLLKGYFVLSFLTVFAPSLLLGISLTISSGLSHSRQAGSAGAGFARFAIAALAALLVTGFLPWEKISLRVLFTTLPWVSLVGAPVFFGLGRPAWRARFAWTAPAVAAAVLLTVTQPPWTSVILTRGLYTMPLEFKQVANLRSLFGETDLLFYGDDRDAIVSVDRVPDAVTLRVNGSTRASAESGMVPHLLAGHIPLLLADDPRTVFLGGLDAGLTLRSIEAYPVEKVYCAEPSAAVLRAARFFSLYNGDALEDARLTLSVKDISNDLLFTTNRYDVMILKSPPPYSYSGAGRLTADFFRLARSRLAPGGIVCQQVNTFELSTDSFRSVVKSFAYCFPNMSVWWIGGDKILMLGRLEPLRFAEAAIRNRMSLSRVEADLGRLGMTDPMGILSCFMMKRDNLMELAGGADLFTSDSNGLVLEWPRRVLQLDKTDVLEELDALAENAVVLIGGMDTGSAEYKILRDRLDRCGKARSSFVRSLGAMREGRINEAIAHLNEASSLCPLNGVYVHMLADYYIVLARSLMSGGRVEDAVGSARRAVELLPRSPRTYYNLASIEVTRDPVTAAALLGRAAQLNPYYVPAYLLKAEAELASDKPKDAAETLGQVLQLEPLNADARHLRGLSFIRRRMYAEGRRELRLVLEADPGNPDVLEALAYSWLLDGDLDEAEKLYKRLLELNPDHLGALNNYATIVAEKGQYREAVRIWTRALELSPGNKDIIDNIEDARQNIRR